MSVLAGFCPLFCFWVFSLSTIAIGFFLNENAYPMQQHPITFDALPNEVFLLRREVADLKDMVRQLSTNNSLPTAEANAYGDFNWLKETCAGVPVGTLRIWSSTGKVPGLSKIGKRCLYHKQTVWNWLGSQTGRKGVAA